MYTPEHFQADDAAAVERLIRENAFATLISVVDGQPVISQLPWIYAEEDGRLWGHLARANPHWQVFAQAPEATVLFQGPHAYVSPRWYERPGVPTWNYATVQVLGTVAVFDEPTRLATVVQQLTAVYESGANPPWSGTYNPRMLEQIVGLELTITRIQGKFKLSQNRTPEDRESVIRHLRGTGRSEADRLAELMQQQDVGA